MLILLVILVVLVLIALFGYYQKNTNAVCSSTKRLEGKTVLVTGGTAGMGLEIAKDMAERGANVTIACPNAAEGQEAVHLIKETTGKVVEFLLLDLASLKDTRRAATEFLSRHSSLHILINNAGVGGAENLITTDGINFVMQVNYFGTFLLTLLLLPILKKTGHAGEPSRIINTASILHMFGNVDCNNLKNKNVWLNLEYYSDSKFCVVLFTRELAERLTEHNVVVNNVNPGAVGTRIFSSWNMWLGGVVSWFFYYIFKTPRQGAQTALYVALDEKAGLVSGEYFTNCQQSRAVYRAYNDKLGKKIWEETIRIVKFEDLE